VADELRRGMVEHGPHQLGFFGMEDGLDLDHAILGVAAADVATLRVVVGVRVLAMTLHERVLATDLLELSPSREPRLLEQQWLVRRRPNPRYRANAPTQVERGLL
jgi:hypothetical protein